jgi:GT2 family glycosyltransferase
MTIGGSGYQEANNRLPCKGAFTYDMLMWIDSDISWEPIDFFRLYESDKPVISGCYQIENNTITAFREAMGVPITAAEIIEQRKPFEVFGVGFGFLAVKQGVFEAIERPWFSQESVVFVKEDGTEDYKFPLMGEDLSWCCKVQKLGIPIWVDPKVRVSHRKTLLLDWSDVTTDWTEHRR